MGNTMNLVLPVKPVPAGINWYVAIALKSCVRKKYPDVNLDIN